MAAIDPSPVVPISAPEKDPDPENVRALYQDTAAVRETFFEWRHKVMTHTFTAVSALGALWAWMFDHEFGRLCAAPLVLAAIYCYVSIGLDARNQRILNDTYVKGAALARLLGDPDGGMFAAIPANGLWENLLTYRWILRITNTLLGTGVLALAVWSYFYDGSLPI